MKNKKTITDYYGKLKGILIILSIFAAVKMLFFAFGLDEEYQLVVAYRNVKGDRLFLDMWEPHQSSAFLCSLLMRPYLALVGETGIVLWLRFCGTLIHLGISIYLYHVLRGMMKKDSAFLVGMIYFNTIPKQIMLPEFGIMQVWFLTLLSLFLIQYYDNSVRNRKYLIFAAFALVLEVLSYPSCLILYFVVIWIIRKRSGKQWLVDVGILTGICALCGIAYLASLLRYNTIEGLLYTLSCIVNSDITHSLSVTDKLFTFGKSMLEILLFCLGIFLLAKAGTAFTVYGRRKKGLETEKKDQFFLWSIWVTVFSCLLELLYWVVFNAGYERMQVHLAVFAVLGVSFVARDKRLAKEAGYRTRIGILFDSIVLAGAAMLAVIYLTDLGVMDSIPHAMSGAIFGITLVIICWEENASDVEKETAGKDVSKGKYRTTGLSIVLFIWCFTAVFGKGYTLRSGTGYNNVLQSAGILKYGPAVGTISDYMCSYVYNCDYEDWQSMVQDGDRVLIMVEQVMNLGTIQYLFKDVEISHYSIVNPTAYDERLLQYWEMFPEKVPNVIIVDDWYGQLMTDPDGWLIQYAENEFGYTTKEEGRYIRVYRKDR
ncbi:MAG: hypothetical protein HDQ96_02255 [Lachnospiraceae bacterium]|nr:hypothetical protein [Lachnospiraceae bacterium]